MHLRIRIEADHGSHPGGSVEWDGDAGELFGLYAELGETSCAAMIDEDPTTEPEPDPGAGPVDATFDLEHQYAPGETLRIAVVGATSWCTSDFAEVVLNIDLTLG